MARESVPLKAAAAAAIFLCLLCPPSLTFAQSGRHGEGHAQGHDTYKHWRKPENPQVICCNNSDCRPTRAYLGNDGLWRAWNGHLWLTVPPGALLPTDYAGDGRSHLCEKGTYIYCFSPGEPRS